MIRKFFELVLSSSLNVALKEDIRDRHTAKKECHSMARGQKNRK